MVTIVLVHNHYDAKHLEEVKAEMLTLGEPTIRAIFDSGNNQWLAIEGCHRLRAAYELGIDITIEDVSSEDAVTVQHDGEEVEVEVSELYERLEDDNRKALNFDDDKVFIF